MKASKMLNFIVMPHADIMDNIVTLKYTCNVYYAKSH